MKFMNEWEIQIAIERTASRPIQNKAARFLAAFKDEVNGHSDGWVYWKPAIRSAERLMNLVQSPVEIADSQFRSALIPIKSFYTRRGNAAGMHFPQEANS